jgi:hypothetical protein
MSLKMNVIRILFPALICLAIVSCSKAPNGTPTSSKTGSVRITGEGINAAEPAVATTDDGRVFLVWVEHREKDADVFLREFDAAGNANGEKVRINPEPGQAKAWRGDPPTIKIGNDGAIYVGWNASEEGPMGASNLELSISHDGGKSFVPPVKVNDDTVPASHGMHGLDVDNDGRVYVVWLDERYLAGREQMHHDEMKGSEPNAELYFAESSDGGKTFSPNRKIAGDVCPCCKASIAAPGEDGNMYVAWRQVLPGSFRHIGIASSKDKGETFSTPVMVSDDRWKINACPVSGPSLFAKGDELEIAWYSGGDAGPHGFYWSHTHDGGKTFSEPMLVSEGSSGGTPVLLGDQVTWADANNIFLATIDEHSVEKRSQLGTGASPAAASASNKILVTYTRPEHNGSSVWLSILNQ